MSWFQDLAGKAENILNQIDQNAASVLHKSDDNKTNKRSKDVRVEIQADEDHLLQDLADGSSAPLSSVNLSPRPMMSLKKSMSSASLDSRRIPVELANERIGSSEVAFPLANSTSTSRRSSVSSRADAQSVVDGDPTVIDFTPEAPSKSGSSSMSTSLNLGSLVSTIKPGKSDLEIARERLETLQNRAKPSELEADGLRAELRSVKDSFNKSQAKMERDLKNVVQSNEELQQKLTWSKQEAEQAKNELQQYRSRAQSTLQMKDAIIEQLKSTSDTQDPSAAPDSSIAHSMELDHLKSERAALLQESRELSDQLVQARSYVDRLESVQKSQQNDFNRKLAELQENMLAEEAKWRDYEMQNHSQMRELQIVRDEMARLQSEYTHQLHAKETELLQLRTFRQSSAASNDIEQRVQSLTQSLVQKQTSLETVTADRNALRFQLEKIEQKHRQTMVDLRQQRPHSINVNDTDDAKARLPMFMQETPFDTGVSRRVKRAYSTLDSMGVRLGVFLRRYPLIRILTIFYVVLLHLWVMVVLCTTAPN